jgi:hypothetical protein
LPATGKLDLRYRTPSSFLHFRAPDALLHESRHFGAEVVTHEIQLVSSIFVCRMYGQLCRGQRKNQPIVTNIHRWISEYVSEESPISRGILEYTITWAPKIMGSLLRLGLFVS